MTTDTSRIDTSPETLERLACLASSSATKKDVLIRMRRCEEVSQTLRALAAEKRAAEDGITDEVVAEAYEAMLAASNYEVNIPFRSVRAGLESAALALQSKDALDAYQLGAECMREKIAQAVSMSPRKPIYETAPRIREITVTPHEKALAWKAAMEAAHESR